MSCGDVILFPPGTSPFLQIVLLAMLTASALSFIALLGVGTGEDMAA
jgi:hypothetical protein